VFAASLRSTATLVPSKLALMPMGPQLPTGLFGSLKFQRPKYWMPGGPPEPPLLLELPPEELPLDDPLLEELLVDDPLPEEPPLDPLPVDPLLVPPLVEPLPPVDPLVDPPLVDAPPLEPPLPEPPVDDPLLVELPLELAPELLEMPPLPAAPVPPELSPLEQNANRQTDPTANTDFATTSAPLDWIMGTHLLQLASSGIGDERVTVRRV
jgi:hypothetical protein